MTSETLKPVFQENDLKKFLDTRPDLLPVEDLRVSSISCEIFRAI